MPDVSDLRIEDPADAVIATVVALESGDQEQASAMADQKLGHQANSRVLGELLKALETLEQVPDVVMEPALDLRLKGGHRDDRGVVIVLAEG